MLAGEFVEQYGAAVDAGQASLLVGAGLSAGAGYPLWSELVQGAADRVGVARVEDLPLWAQYVENKQAPDEDALLDEVVSRIAAVDPVPTENHGLLAQLPVREVWTTNYDPLIETADQNLQVIEQDVDLTGPRQGARRLYKMHGSIDHGSTTPTGGRAQLVITRNDYESYADTHPRFWRLLQAQFLTSSFLFLGFSLTDPNFDAIFALVRRAITDRVMPHYALMKRPSDDAGQFDSQRWDFASIGIEIVEIADYDEIPDLLRRLIARTLPLRLFVAGSGRRPDAEEWGGGEYPTAKPSAELDEIARQLGAALAAADVPGVVAGGELGANVGYAFLNSLAAYEPERFTLVRRRSDEDVSPPRRRLGQIRFSGDEPSELRDEAFASVRCVVVLGGGSGTLNEIERAHERQMSIIPLAASGGAARQLWSQMRADLASYDIGQRPIDPGVFERLGHADHDVAIEATVQLVTAGLFM